MQKKVKTYLFIYIFFIALSAQAKVRLLTFHYNRPDFIRLQYKTFEHFLENDFELIVFNDASKQSLCNQIEQTCAGLGIQCVNFPQKNHLNSFLIDHIDSWAKIPKVTGLRELALLKGKHPSVRHCHVIQYALDNFCYNHDDLVGLIDGDMFLVDRINIREYLEHYDMVGRVLQDETKSVEYAWPGIVFFDNKKLPNRSTLRFNLFCIGRHITDTGGESYFYLNNNPTVKFKKYKMASIANNPKIKLLIQSKKLKRIGFSNKEIKLIKKYFYHMESFIDHKFLHYSRSSFIKELNPYAPETFEYHQKKSFFLEYIINNRLKNTRRKPISFTKTKALRKK